MKRRQCGDDDRACSTPERTEINRRTCGESSHTPEDLGQRHVSSAIIQAVDVNGAIGGARCQRDLVGVVREAVDGSSPVAHEALVEFDDVLGRSVEIVYADTLMDGTDGRKLSLNETVGKAKPFSHHAYVSATL